jgi:hypothetical protein
MKPLKGISPLTAAGRGSVAASFRDVRRRPLALCAPALLAALAGCADNAFYVRSGGPAAVPIDAIGLDAASLAAETLDVAVTFKSDGVVQAGSSDTLFHSIEAGLKSCGIGRLRRSGPPLDDVSGEIAALEPLTALAAPTAPAKAPAARTAPRLLVLVENHPDLRDGTAAKYFVSGMTFGAWSLNKPTDRYDITLAYRDPHGQARVYHGHQDLIFSTGSSVFGRDDEALAGLRRYDDPLAAFGAAMNNSIKGGPGVVRVGHPDFDTPAGQQAASTAGR